jgi:hypothetical protein
MGQRKLLRLSAAGDRVQRFRVRSAKESACKLGQLPPREQVAEEDLAEGVILQTNSLQCWPKVRNSLSRWNLK